MFTSSHWEPSLRVIGIDPGSRFLGYAVVESEKARGPRLLGHGVVEATRDAPLPQRLRDIYEALQTVVQLYRPTSMAVEGVFTHKNSRSALILGHARGIALLLGAQAGLAVHEYAPARVKKSVGAGGRDGKTAVERMVTQLLRLQEPLKRADAYDAVAVALCHCHEASVRGLFAVSVKSLTRTPKSKIPETFAARLTLAYSSHNEVSK